MRFVLDEMPRFAGFNHSSLLCGFFFICSDFVGERVPSKTIFYYANTAACKQSEVAFLKIAAERKWRLRRIFLTCKNQEETNAAQEQAEVLAEQALQCLNPKKRHCDKQFSTLFIRTTTHIRMVEGCCVCKPQRTFLTSRLSALIS